MSQYLSRRRIIALIVLIVIAALAFLPMRLAAAMVGLDQRGVTARSVGGTVWNGRFEQVRVGGMALGTIDAGLQPLGLLLGRARFDIARTDDPTAPLTGAIEVGRTRAAVIHLTGATIGGSLGDLPLERVAFDDLSLLFDNGRCVSASGTMRLTLAIRFAGMSISNGLAGQARCDGDALLLPLTGESGLERMTIRLTSDRRYTVQFGVNGADPLLAAALSAAGFSNRGGAYLRDMRGQF